MRSGARNYSGNKARNFGQSLRTPKIASKELDKSTQVYDNAFTVSSEDAYLYRYSLGERKCSHLNWAATGGESFPEDDDFEAPVIIIDEDEFDGEEEESILDETLEMLQEPKDICPLCYGTGNIGSYRVINSWEVYLDTTYENIVEKKDVVIEPGKPFYFRPSSPEALVTFRVNMPAFFDSLYRITSIYKESRSHVDVSASLIQIGIPGEEKIPMSEDNLRTLLKSSPRIDIEFKVIEASHGFFIRLLNGKNTIRVNFPDINEEVEEGEYDYFDSITVSMESYEDISTKDIIKEIHENRFWKVTSVENKKGQRKDLGKDVGLRRVRNFERFALLP